MGNRSEWGSPWGSYPCAGSDQWVAICVASDDQWKKLAMALGDPDWSKNEAYETVEGRRAAQDEIDEHIREWTSPQTKVAVTSTLQMFGIPSAPMLTGAEQSADPHLQAHGYPRWVHQQDLGWMAFEGPCWKATGMADAVVKQAPKVGEHTREIAREMLGLSDPEVEVLVDTGALEVPLD